MDYVLHGNISDDGILEPRKCVCHVDQYKDKEHEPPPIVNFEGSGCWRNHLAGFDSADSGGIGLAIAQSIHR